jgi:hypothetical protein
MDESFFNIFTCKYCKNIYSNPVIFPCNEAICSKDIESIHHDQTTKTFKCVFCTQNHKILPKGFKPEMKIAEILHLNQTALKEIESNISYKNACIYRLALNSELNKLKHLEKFPSFHLRKQIDNIRNSIDCHREKLIIEINQESENMMEKLRTYEELCSRNFEIIKNDSTKTDDLSNEAKLIEFKLKMPILYNYEIVKNEKKVFELLESVRKRTHDINLLCPMKNYIILRRNIGT